MTSTAAEERICRSARHITEEPLVPELEAIAAAAADELCALMDEARDGEQAPCSGVPAAAGAAIAATPGLA